jgi:hypothetical protein
MPSHRRRSARAELLSDMQTDDEADVRVFGILNEPSHKSRGNQQQSIDSHAAGVDEIGVAVAPGVITWPHRTGLVHRGRHGK